MFPEMVQRSPEWYDARRGMVTKIPLTRDLYTLVDTDDADRVLSAGSWHALANRNGKFYAAHKKGRGLERLHSFLTNWPLVDHINGDGLDNRRCNLRPATLVENARNRRLPSNNTSGFKGVNWHRGNGKWAASITADGRRHSLGYHDSPEDAGRAYDAAAIRLHGEFACLNFPGDLR
jgi:hypothetical protein